MKDIKINGDGEFIFEDDDFSDALDDRVIAQDIKLVLKNIKNEYWLGSDLEQYIGKPNTEGIKADIQKNVKQEILSLDYLKEENVKIIIKQHKTFLMIQAAIKSPLTKKSFIISTKLSLNSSKLI